jgi:hypothetical protein
VLAEHFFERAEDFLAALRPGNEIWKPDPAAWVFRGHADSGWLLLPSWNRRAALTAYFGPKYLGEGPYCEPVPEDLGALMVQFVYSLERGGQAVPGVGDRFKIEHIAEKVKGGRPSAHVHEVMGLAQQRLTTLLILLTLIRERAQTADNAKLADRIGDLMMNRHENGNDHYKLLPT